MNDSRLAASAVGTVALLVLLLMLLVLLRAERRRARATHAALATEPADLAEVQPGDERLIEKPVDVPAEASLDNLEESAPNIGENLVAVVRPFRGLYRNLARRREPKTPQSSDDSLGVAPLVVDSGVECEPLDVHPQDDERKQPPATAISTNLSEISGAAMSDMQIYRRRVDAAIRGLGNRVGPAEAPAVAGARLRAALDRLEVPVGLVRPRLSPATTPLSRNTLGRATKTLGSSRGATSMWSAPEPLSTEQASVPVLPDLNSPHVGGNNIPAEQPSAAGSQSEDTAPDKDPAHAETLDRSTAEDVEVVLPVPPMAPRDQKRRRGMWGRDRHG
ncbi:hypothetical protein BH09ACT10_BH09ACT10_10310 [soil metagenome]